MVFKKKYSDLYNIIYKKKKYLEESKYIISILKKNKIFRGDILELGLGTGNHAKYLIENKYDITGVEKSSSMISFAKKITGLNYVLGDIRSVRLKKKFSAVISLFHVINYMLDLKDLNNFFKTASIHLNKDGILVFDTWNYKSVKRFSMLDCKVFKLKKMNIYRVSSSIILRHKLIKIIFKFIIKKNKKIIDTFEENHLIRCFTYNEIFFYAKKNNFELINKYKMLEFLKPNKNNKSICFIFKKIR